MWENTCNSIELFVNNHIQSIKTVEDALICKEYLLIYQETMSDSAFGMDPKHLMPISQSIWFIFEQLEYKTMMKICHNALDNCAYNPLTVTSEAQLEVMIKAFNLDKIEVDEIENQYSQYKKDAFSNNDILDNLEDNWNNNNKTINPKLNNNNNSNGFIPITYPFSEAIPMFLHELHYMIVHFFMFSIKNNHLKSIGENICRAVQKSVVGLAKIMMKKLMQDGNETPISKACQISIDSHTLSLCCHTYIKSYISGVLVFFKWNDSIDLHLPNAIANIHRELVDTSNKSQDFVLELLSNKVVDLLESLVFINWAPESLPHQGNSQIDELIDYLRATFMCLAYLPQAARDAAHFTCCTQASNKIIDFILSYKVEKINIYGIVGLQYDVENLLSFTDLCSVKQLKQCFSELYELVRILLYPDLISLGDNPQVRRNLFPHVDTIKLIKILEKYTSFPTNTPATLPKLDKRSNASLIKKLKSNK
jgi:hypothetical protein